MSKERLQDRREGMSQSQLWGLFHGFCDQRKHPMASLTPALEGIRSRLGRGRDGEGLLEVCGRNMTPVSFLKFFPRKNSASRQYYSSSPLSPFPSPPHLPSLLFSPSFIFPHFHFLPLFFLSDPGLCHMVQWHQTEWGIVTPLTSFYFLLKMLTTCLFSPLSNICLLKTSGKSSKA